MGLKLNGLIAARPATPADLRGKAIGIDVPNLMYAFYGVRMQGPADDGRRPGAVRAAIHGVMRRANELAAWGARPVLILDGPPHALKREMLVQRDATRAFPALRRTDYAPLHDEARAARIAIIQAPHDAEAQGSAMARAGKLDVVATTDWDALAMGAPVLLRGLSAGSGRWMLIHAETAFAKLGLTRADLCSAAVLMGCDFAPGFDGIGPKRAMKLVLAHRGDDPLEGALRALGASVDAAQRARDARTLLLEPAHDAAPSGKTGRTAQAKLDAR